MDSWKTTRWQINRPKHGAHAVQDRASKQFIGEIRPYRSPGKEVEYLATRPDGTARDFRRRWDAAYWLMQAFDSSCEAVALCPQLSPRLA